MADFLFGLNTSTIQPASLMDKIKAAGQAGYDAIELWINDVEKYVTDGGKLSDLVHALDDNRLQRPSMISLRDWCTADEAKWKSAVDSARRRLDTARQLSVERIVAGPPGEEVPLELAIDRYRQLLEISLQHGVPASVEFLGFVQGINTLEKAWAICAGAGFAEGTITPDVWHMYRGGSNFKTLDDIPPDHISVFHWNDAPSKPPRTEQTDADRVYPGDGIVDLKSLANQLRQLPWQGTLTLELFNRSYWEQDPFEVARIGLEKMKASVAA
jgi:sugar phosphate isomerase/epimerase